MAEINGWRGLQNLAERKTGRIVVSVAERWRCCSKPVTGHLWLLLFDVKSTTKQFWLLLFRVEVHAESKNPFNRPVMCDAVFASENHFCFRCFSLAFITSAFSRFRSGKAKSELKHEQAFRVANKFGLG